jgi:SAM-dependent methyltransferase
MKKYLMNNIDPDENINFSDEVSLWSAPFGIRLLEKINYRENINALDIGCGAGFPLIELAMRLGEGSVIYGMDPLKSAIKRTREKINFYGISNIRLIEGVAESIPLKFTNGTSMLNHWFIKLAFLSAWKTFLPEDKLEHIFDTIENRMNESSGKTGGVTLTIPFAVIDAVKVV